MERTRQWKQKPMAFGSEVARMVRSDRHEAHRRQQREQHLNRLRAVETQQSDEEEVLETPEDRAVRLEKWKAERDLKKKLEAKNKRPAFKIGVPHHKFFSPTSNDPLPHCHKKPKLPSPPKRVTAATLRRRQAKAAATTGLANPQAPANSTLVPSKQIQKVRTPVMTRSRRRAQLHEPAEEPKMSLAPKDYAFKIPTGVAPMPLFGRVVIPDTEMILNFNLNDTKTMKAEPKEPQIEAAGGTPEKAPTPKENSPKFEQKTEIERWPSTQTTDSSIESVVLRLSSQSGPTPEDDPEKENVEMKFDTPNQSLKVQSPARFSPFVVASRGKSSARKEQKQRISLFLSPDEVPTKDTVMQMLNISAEDEEKTAQYYKHLLQSEEESLKGLCVKWRAVQDEAGTSEDGHYLINQAIGQTDLLLHKKFEKFRQLVVDCETGRGEQLVRCADLQGFWEMMKMDVDNCYSRFNKLDELKSKNWAEEESTKTKVVKRKPAPIQKKKIAGKSNMRAFIEAARKKKLGINNSEETPEEQKPAPKPSTPRRTSLLRPVSPHSLTKLTPRGERMSLLKLVQLTESAKKQAQASFAMVKISQQLKTPEVHHDDTISYINSDQTPGKGILKKVETAPSSENRLNKSLRVNFNDTVEMSQLPVEQEEEEEEGEENTSRSLAAALARIDSLDFGHDNEEHHLINKKLFQDDDDIEDDVFDVNLPQAEAPSAEQAPASTSDQDEDFYTPPTIPQINIVAPTPSMTIMPPPRISAGRTRRTANAESEAALGLEVPSPSKKGRRGRRQALGVQKVPEVTPSPVKPTRRGRSKGAEHPPVDEIKIFVTEPTPAVDRSRSSTHRYSEEMETESEETLPAVPSSPQTPLPNGNKSADVSTEPPVIAITEPTPAVRRSRSGTRNVEDADNEETLFALPVPPKNPRKGRKSHTTLVETEHSKIVVSERMKVPKPPRKEAHKSNGEIDIEAIIAMSPRVVLERISVDEIKKRIGQVEPAETNVPDTAKSASRASKSKARRHSEAPAKSEATGSRHRRNRSILVENVQRRNRRSAKSDTEEEKIPVSETREQVDHHSDEGGDKENGEIEKVATPRTPRAPIPVNSTPSRKSARKSVRFVPEDDCTVCKSIPLTPRSLKARISFLGDHSDAVTHPLPNGDLMAFDSPATSRRVRLRRSSAK